MGLRRSIIVLYDSECALCRSQMRLIRRLDWFGRLSTLPMKDPRAKNLVPGVTQAELEEAIHCVTADQRVYRGARCFRHLALRLPLLIPLGVVLWIPGAIWVAEVIYRYLSRNRYRFNATK